MKIRSSPSDRARKNVNLMKKTLLVLSALFALFAFAFANVNPVVADFGRY